MLMALYRFDKSVNPRFSLVHFSRGRQRLIQVLTSIRDRSMLKKKVVRKFGTSMMEQILDTCVLLYSIMFGLHHIMKEVTLSILQKIIYDFVVVVWRPFFLWVGMHCLL
ncbi:unnamed protein product [Lupinus luteus]|uniref:Uncharacterized protein n=1 Tax=Lupinus luteus TaxID=3873 RepID=A0AAV1W5R6_LUPLU